jgi:sortase A
MIRAVAVAAVALGVLAAARIAEGLYSPGRRSAAGWPAVLSRAPQGDLIARLSFQRHGREWPVFAGVEVGPLAAGAGHLPGSALPGAEGSYALCVIAARLPDLSAAAGQLRLGDRLEMRTPFGIRSYRVTERRLVRPERLPLDPKSGARLLLLAPYPADSVGPAPMRLAVFAEAESPARKSATRSTGRISRSG